MSDNTREYSFDVDFLKYWFWQSLFMTVVFVALRTGGAVSWSWIWILCPIWILFIAAVMFILVAGIMLAVQIEVDRRREKNDSNRT